MNIETKQPDTATNPITSEANRESFPIPIINRGPSPWEMAEECAATMAGLVRILGEYGVTVTPGEIHSGPVITCYEVVPSDGACAGKIASLDKNIAQRMDVQSVRILTPTPDKNAIGIEIPNKVPALVSMRNILKSESWAASKAEIPLALGKDISGEPIVSDLTQMSNLLIAGATGTGKSVCVNSIIASIAFRNKPRDVRLIMIDPKVVELKVFNELPLMLIPVVTEPKKVPAVLNWLIWEMERRHRVFDKIGVGNIMAYNDRESSSAHPDVVPQATPDSSSTPPADDNETSEHMPYIVVIIDELSDLMMVARDAIETSIAKLSHRARAAGIHLVIATQRPSANVLTEGIKAHLPSRIAFQVASQVASRTILDANGAETLIGRGDMLFTPSGGSHLVRAQGVFISDDEVKKIVDFLIMNNPPAQYAQTVKDAIDSAPIADED